jgi:hypothetical protein
MPENVIFEKIELHDGHISSIELDWEKKTCTIKLAAFLDPGKNAVDCRLLFENVSNLSIPHQAPWGESVFINEHRRDASNVFTIEMQSGDEIRVTADVVKLVRNGSSTS